MDALPEKRERIAPRGVEVKMVAAAEFRSRRWNKTERDISSHHNLESDRCRPRVTLLRLLMY